MTLIEFHSLSLVSRCTVSYRIFRYTLACCILHIKQANRAL